MAAEGFPTLRFKECKTYDALKIFYAMLQVPLIVKPAKGSGSEGVCYVSCADDLESAWQYATTSSLSIIAEEFLSGPEISVESFSVDCIHEILMITEKNTTDIPHFVETGHQMPCPLNEEETRAVHVHVQSFLDFIGHQIGPSHCELRLTKQGPRIIEGHTRGGGDFIWEMVQWTCGINFVAATVAHLLKQDPLPRTPRAQAAAIRFMRSRPGTITQISGLTEASAVAGVVRVSCSATPGDRVQTWESSDARIGYVLGVGNSLKETITTVDDAIRCVEIEIQ